MKNDMRGEVTNVFFLCVCVQCFAEVGDFPENLHRVVYVTINKRSFESFMCLDLILQR